MPSITASVDVVTQYVIDKLKANASTLVSASGVVVDANDIYYGDQDKFPRTPSICVDPNVRRRDLQGVSFRTDNNFSIYIIIYHAKIQDNQLTRKEAQQISEAVETLLHQDPQLGGNIIHCFCSLNESGYVYRQNTMYRTNRVTLEAYSKTRLR